MYLGLPTVANKTPIVMVALAMAIKNLGFRFIVLLFNMNNSDDCMFHQNGFAFFLSWHCILHHS